ncbi:YqhG family protein [Halalkalibacillus halophilus]|uniref:YqhG family protein n=1 Tax=Halalkalibacillus halophilus TaxID=392827 RepID=UPI00040EB958|nr:YqhG family protein [Halalkalibacillus halophilus]
MNQVNLHSFLIDFFTTRNATLEEHNDHFIKIRLTKELDIQLMNRPFYWQYREAMNIPGEPLTLSLITNKEYNASEGQFVHIGSKIIQDIFRIIQQEGRNTILYEKIHTDEVHSPLLPWYVLNIHAQLQGWQQKEITFSIGILLTTGSMRFEMMEAIDSLRLQQELNNYVYTVPSIISKERAKNWIITELEQRIINGHELYSKESLKLYENEMQLSNRLHQSDQQTDTTYQHVTKQIEERLYPSANLNLINNGLIYLSKSTTRKILSV